MRTLAAAAALLCTALGATAIAQSGLRLRAEVDALSADRTLAQQDPARARLHALRAQAVQAQDHRHLARMARIEDRLGRERRAQGHRVAAALARPSAPQPWAQLAQAALERGEAARALPLLLHSAAVGDQERGLWTDYAKLALRHANTPMPDAARAFLDERVLREFRRNGAHLMGHALVRRREAALCRVVARVEPEPYWCGVARYARPICDQAGLTRAQASWCADLAALWQQFDYPR